jgi:NAD(P)-dependent dehydrogenase (short-subunit alcohol dehydrogenase family)
MSDRVAVVTGASRSIGKQTALMLARRGLQVALAARTEAPRPSTPGTLGQTAGEVRAVGVEPLVVRAVSVCRKILILNRMANVIAQEGLAHRIAVINVEPGFVLTETMATTFEGRGVEETEAIPPTVPASAITYLATCADPLQYTGEIVSGPDLVASLNLGPSDRPGR